MDVDHSILVDNLLRVVHSWFTLTIIFSFNGIDGKIIIKKFSINVLITICNFKLNEN